MQVSESTCVGGFFALDTSGTSAPSSGCPAPSRTRNVGICLPPAVAALKKCRRDVIGLCDAGRCPCACSGSFGVVYKAVDTRESPDSENRYRAVKIIRKAGRTPKELAIIRREVALHSIVAGHPNIITIHDAYDQ